MGLSRGSLFVVDTVWVLQYNKVSEVRGGVDNQASGGAESERADNLSRQGWWEPESGRRHRERRQTSKRYRERNSGGTEKQRGRECGSTSGRVGSATRGDTRHGR